MTEPLNAIEARLTAAAIAWQDYRATRHVIERLGRYQQPNTQMRAKLHRAWSRNLAASNDLCRLLKIPARPEMLSPESGEQMPSPIVPLDSGLVRSGDSFITPRTQTGD